MYIFSLQSLQCRRTTNKLNCIQAITGLLNLLDEVQIHTNYPNSYCFLTKSPDSYKLHLVKDFYYIATKIRKEQLNSKLL